MFGYVKPFQPEMRLKEYDAYKSVYCGLCKELGKSYGVFSRLTLSYDFTFLAILAMSVNGATPSVGKIRCLVNPLKRCTTCYNNSTKEVAAQAMITLYYKALDQLSDETFLRKLPAALTLPFFRHFRNKAAAVYPVYDQLAAQMMKDQALAEEQGAGVDYASEPTANYLAQVCEMLTDDPVQKRVLKRFGYLLGRYVYLSDALDDLEKDEKRGRFNPFLKDTSAADLRASGYQPCIESINGTIGELAKTFELLTLDQWKPVLSNVIYYGLSQSLHNILQKKEKKHDRSL